MQNLEKEVTESQILLTWTITEDFTAVSGELLPEIVGQKDDTVVIKYEMTPMIVRNSILEQYNGGIDAIDKALREMQSILAQVEQLIAKMPIIKGGTWWLYDVAIGDYVDSGYPAQGDKGDTGETGATGEKGDPGEPGKQGEPGEKGDKGDTGEPGKDGASAYEIAQKNGYEGTESDWLTSLHGAKGDKGDKGDTGDTGERGEQGEKGEPGEKGDTGEPGKDGVNGKDGADGVDGKDGADGYSPTATVTETDAGAVISITDKNGTTTTTIKNGISGDAASWGDYTPGCEEGESAKYCTAKLVTVTGKQTWQVLPSISTVSHNALDIVPDGLFVLDLSPDVETLATRIKALEDSIGNISTVLATMVEV